MAEADISGTGMRKINKINKITIDYMPAEDRFRATTLLEDGSGLVMWLTQKMLNKLVSGLVGVFEERLAVPETQVDAKPISQRETRVAAQFWRQAEADLTIQGAARAEVKEGESPQVLIDGMRLRQHHDTYFLHFAWGQQSVYLPADETWLRQFMRILYRRYREAEWSTAGVWPVWFDTAAQRNYVKQTDIN